LPSAAISQRRGDPTGICWTAQAVDQYDWRVVLAQDPMGRPVYWFTVVPLEPHREGTDLWAVERGLVSLTPLRLDLTDAEQLARARGAAREQRRS
jgi:5'-nucleotidase